jgi:hypothetical protein
MHLAQGAAQRINLTFVGVLLTLKHFEHFENFFHLFERSSKGIDHTVNLLDRLLDRGGRGRT